MNLYQKYRPADFSEMIGNDVAVKALSKCLGKKVQSHVYLFIGPSGTGKTTAARIMAAKLGAEDLDICEYNTASTRGIDTARKIISEMNFCPNGKATVYILDEAHKWTNEMQNAMLKPLEDVPEHVYFFLCTTEANKMIKALVSRCTKIVFKSVDIDEIEGYINTIAKAEKIKLPKGISKLIAEKSEGSVRDALVLLENVSNLDEIGEMKEVIGSWTSEEDNPQAFELAQKLLYGKGGWKEIAEMLRKMSDNGTLDDAEGVRRIIMRYMSNTLISGKENKRAALILDCFKEPTYNNGKDAIILDCASAIF